jgi:hypothetical protein
MYADKLSAVARPGRSPISSTATSGISNSPISFRSAGIQVGSVLFHAAVTDAVGTIVRRVSDDPPKYLVKLLFSFRGVDEVEVPEDRIVAK